jgi:hypothetical protein
MADATIKQIKDFFEESNVGKFAKEYKELSDESKQQLKEGIGNGTFTY